MTEISYKGTVFAYFDDAHAYDVKTPIEDILEGAKVMFSQITRSEMVDLLQEYIDAKRKDEHKQP